MISGHVTRSVLDRYKIGSEDDLVDAAMKLEKRRGLAPRGTIENSQIGRELDTEKPDVVANNL
jgi:hypothetical protein